MPYAVQVYVSDDGRTWKVDSSTVREEPLVDAPKIASDELDVAYRARLERPAPVGHLQVHVYDGPVTGPVVAMATLGVDTQWQALRDLLAEVSADIASFDAEIREAEQRAASARTGRANARKRLENITRAATRAAMPQQEIAHAAARSREWVRQVVAQKP